MKKSENTSPILYLMLTQITSGMFIFYWIINLMRSVNVLANKPVFNVKIYEIFFGSGLLFHLTALAITLATFSSKSELFQISVTTLMTTSGVLLFSMFYSLLRLNIEICHLEGRNFGVSGVFSTVALVILWFYIGFQLQKRVNILENKQIDKDEHEGSYR